MFGIGFFEILIILIVAVIFLGPEKLPQAIVDFVKFFRAVKKTINEAKDTLDKELEISKLSSEVSDIKSHFETNMDSITKDMDLSNLQEIKEIKEEMQDLGRLPNKNNVGGNVEENKEDLENLDNKLGTKENLFSEYSLLPQNATSKTTQKSTKLAKNTKKPTTKSAKNTKSSTKSTKSTKTTKSIAKSTPKSKQTNQPQKSTKTPKSKPQKSSPNNAKSYKAL